MPLAGFKSTISAIERPQTAQSLGLALTYNYCNTFIISKTSSAFLSRALLGTLFASSSLTVASEEVQVTAVL
jgi:hypothetical protein